ncbi:hypothetical protein BH23VER1_BH23VER1_11430 [soil metagenome]
MHHDEPGFYIGWQAKAPPGTGKFVRRTVIVLLAVTVALAVLTALAQRPAGPAIFEFGKTHAFTGLFQKHPYPHLLVPRPGSTDPDAAFSRFYLVSQGKFGLPPNLATESDNKWVSLEGTLIYRGDQTMIELVPDSLQPSDPAGEPTLTPYPAAHLGTFTFQGEIVDSKCYLGVMNPGDLETHRACATRCISGGIPPVLLVRQQGAPPLYLLLTDSQGGAVNNEVLDLVALPVEISGTLTRHGDMLTLQADPGTYRRLTSPP